jgi:putative long chain acyl-CoA synthase
VVDEIPLTTWYRPRTGPLREDGIPEPGGELAVWCLNARGDLYVPLTAASQRRLARAA